MVLDFFGLAKLFGTSTLNGPWWYMSAAIIFIICVPLFNDKGRISGIYSCGCCGISAGQFPWRLWNYRYLCIFYRYFSWECVWPSMICLTDGLDMECWSEALLSNFFWNFLRCLFCIKAYRTLPLKVYSEIHWGGIQLYLWHFAANLLMLFRECDRFYCFRKTFHEYISDTYIL